MPTRRERRPPPPPLPDQPEGLLSPEALAELQVLDRDPLSAGFTRERNRAILEAAIFYAGIFTAFPQLWEQAEKYRKLRRQNTVAQKRWLQKTKKEARHAAAGQGA